MVNLQFFVANVMLLFVVLCNNVLHIAEGARTSDVMDHNKRQDQQLFQSSSHTCSRPNCRLFLSWKGYAVYKIDGAGVCKTRCLQIKPNKANMGDWKCGRCSYLPTSAPTPSPVSCTTQAPVGYSRAIWQSHRYNQSICYQGYSDIGWLMGTYEATTDSFRFEFTVSAHHMTYAYDAYLPVAPTCKGYQTPLNNTLSDNCISFFKFDFARRIIVTSSNQRVPFTMLCDGVFRVEGLQTIDDTYDSYGNYCGTFQWKTMDSLIVTTSYNKEGVTTVVKTPALRYTYSAQLPFDNIRSNDIGVGIIPSRLPKDFFGSWYNPYIIYNKYNDNWIITFGYYVYPVDTFTINQIIEVTRSCRQDIPSIVQADCGTFDVYGNGYGRFEGVHSGLNLSYLIEYDGNNLKYFLRATNLINEWCKETIPITSSALRRSTGSIQFMVDRSRCSFIDVTSFVVSFYRYKWYLSKDNVRNGRYLANRTCSVSRGPTDCSTSYDPAGNGYGTFTGNLMNQAKNETVARFTIEYNTSMLVYILTNNTLTCTNQSIPSRGNTHYETWGSLIINFQNCSLIPGFLTTAFLTFYDDSWFLDLPGHYSKVDQRLCY